MTQIEPTKSAEALTVINAILGSGKPEMMRNHLRELMDNYFLINGGAADMGSVYCTFQALDRALQQMDALS